MLTPADKQHREDFRQFCIREADPRFRQTMELLYDQWSDYNRTFFADALLPPYILVAPTVSPMAYGDTRTVSDFGGTTQITIKRTLVDGTHSHFEAGTHDQVGQERFVLDVLLHEVVHQYCIEALGKPEFAEKGHGLIFAGECTRIGGLIGLPPVGPARASRRKPGLASCGQWPHNVRPTNYYRGAYAPDGVQITPTVPTGAPGGDPRVPQLEAEVLRLKAELATTTADRDQLRADLAYAASSVPTPSDAAAQALADLLTTYGADLVRDRRKLEGLLHDVCSDLNLEVALLLVAARLNLADLAQPGMMATIASAKLARRLTVAHGIAPALAVWTIEAWQRSLYAANGVQPVTVTP